MSERAAVIIPNDRQGWWGGPDIRPRCQFCDKVAFVDREAAERSAAKITARGTPFNAYLGKPCGNWHVGHKRSRK